MMNYQKFKEKLNSMDSRKLEKMRLTSILTVAFLFGVFLYNNSFAEEAKGNTQAQNSSKYQASVISAVSSTVNDTNDNIVNTENNQEPIKDMVSKEEDTTTQNQEITSNTSSTTQELKKDNASEDIQSVANYIYPETNIDFLPIRDYSIQNLTLNTKAGIVMTEDGNIIFQNKIDEKLKIASLTKVMTAIAVLEDLPEDEVIKISQSAINTEGASGHLKVGEQYLKKDLLTIMLLVSSNDAAVAFQEHFKSKGMDMIAIMNKKAKELGLLNTSFQNPVGFDSTENYSTARDYANLIKYSLNNKELWDILSTKNELINSLDPNADPKRAISSNRLMFDDSLWGIIGGKTGYTEGAGGCLMTVFDVKGQNGRENKKLISVVLGASNAQTRFTETENLINWIRKAYIF